MAFHEIHPRTNLFYISFSGQLDEKKLEQFFLWRQKIDPEKNLPITLAFDLDKAGFYFDLYFIKALMERERSNPMPKLERKDLEFKFSLDYGSNKNELIEVHHKRFENKLAKLHGQIGFSPITLVRFKKQLVLAISVEALYALKNGAIGALEYWKTFIACITHELLNSKIFIRKAELHKDWNQALIWSKNYSAIKDLRPIENKVLENIWALVPGLPNSRFGQSFHKVIQVRKNDILLDIGDQDYLKISKDKVLKFYREQGIVQNSKTLRFRNHARKK